MPAFAPDLAVEVLSPSEHAGGDGPEAVGILRRRGPARLGGRPAAPGPWPIFHCPDGATVLDATMTLDGGAVLPGFELPLADLFGELDRHGA